MGKKVLKAKDKIYIADAALRNAVLLKSDQLLDDPGEIGLVAETTVLRHIFASYYRETLEISYWQIPAKRTGRLGRPRADDIESQERLLEVDIVVKSPSHVIPFEVKYRESARLSQGRGIVEFCRTENVLRAYFVTKRDEDFGVQGFPDHPAKYLSIPAHILTCLLGQAERVHQRGRKD